MAEKEYIEREKAIDALTERNLVVHMDSVNDGLVASCHRSAQRIIANIPASDVRPVVLCRDCEYYFKDEDGYEMCDNSEGYDHVTEDGFCAWAKKREKSR